MPDPREPDISREDDPLTGFLGFAAQGFASGYHQGWADAKAGRPYGATPAAGKNADPPDGSTDA